MSTLTNLLDRFSHLFYVLMVLGAIDLGVRGVASTSVLSSIFGDGSSLTVVYILIGIAGLMSLDGAIDRLSRR